MAIAYKCDRCGWLTAKKEEIIKITFLPGTSKQGSLGWDYDLCAKCANDVKQVILKKPVTSNSPESTSVAEGRL